MIKVTEEVRRYLQARLAKEAITTLNEIIRNLRIVLQQVLIDYFLTLPLPKAREFRFALGDQLHNVCNELKRGGGYSVADQEHHQYCVREILACFEWAEQIKEEIPDDPVTQRILAVDIPILRPFDYGLIKGKPVGRKSGS